MFARLRRLNVGPTAARINNLPAWAQQYIYDLSTRADPAGDMLELVREINQLLVQKQDRLDEAARED
jgi:hypothetical protein